MTGAGAAALNGGADDMKPLFFRAMAAVANELSTALLGLCAGTAQAHQKRKPGVPSILSDNIGYDDIGV